MQSLPIDALLPEVIATAQNHSSFVLEAEAGAGKTTRVPAALLDAGLFPGQIWVAEPRRLAARLVAHRVSSERNEPLGERIGYTVRFEDKTSALTRLRYVTSGILLRRLVTDPQLANIDCVILDEFHERHIDTDLALALLLELQRRRPEFRLVIMSATLDSERISRHMGGCPRLYSEGRVFPLEIEFAPQAEDRSLEKQVSSAVRELVLADPKGSILVFLPGIAEIRKCATLIQPLSEKAGFDLATLHGDLPLAEQARAIEPGHRPRIVLTTNVAESSVTVQGITAVVDSGLVRRLDNPAAGIARLALAKVSRASATQRAGRAGRVAAGRVKRLFSRGDFETRPEFDVPEILRLDFCEALLLLHGANVSHPESLRFLDAPEPTNISSAGRTLELLGAVDGDGHLTPLGRDMLALNVHPRLARLALGCADLGHPRLGACVAALLSERDVRLDSRAPTHFHDRRRRDVVAGSSDLLELVELFEWAEELRFAPRAVADIGLEPRTLRTVEQAYSRLHRLLLSRNTPKSTTRSSQTSESREDVLELSVLAAYPDRIAKRRTPQQPDFVLRNGQTARLAENSVVLEATFIVAVDVDERKSPGRAPETIIRVASAFNPDRLLDVASNDLQSEETWLWADPPGRVEVRSRIRLGSLTIEESRRPARPGQKTAAFLVELAKNRGLFRSTEVTALLLRLEHLRAQQLVTSLPDNLEDALLSTAEELLLDAVSLDGLDGTTLMRTVSESLPAPIPERLRNDTPEQVTLPGGRRCTVHYEPQMGPWIESRLQDFFGMAQTPTILRGRVPLTVHLLAPNQRAVQITNDLMGFWSTHYPELRRQLMRRYPKHSWPEDGRTASPPEPRPPHQRR